MCQMLEHGPPAQPGRPSQCTVPAMWGAGHFAGAAVQAQVGGGCTSGTFVEMVL